MHLLAVAGDIFLNGRGEKAKGLGEFKRDIPHGATPTGDGAETQPGLRLAPLLVLQVMRGFLWFCGGSPAHTGTGTLTSNNGPLRKMTM